jgi:hypothetical protein
MGLEEGCANEHSEWIAAGHGQHCLMAAHIFEDSGTQFEPEPVSPSICMQTSIESTPITAPPPPSLPTTILAPPAPPVSPVPASILPSYKPIMDDMSIECPISLVKDSPPNFMLGIIWQHAFEEGKKASYSEGAKLFEGTDIGEIMKAAAE